MRLIYFVFISCILSISAYSQVLIIPTGTGVSNPSATLELRDSLKGFLLNIVDTNQMNLLKPNAPNGLMVFNKEHSKPYYFNKEMMKWMELSSESSKWILNPIEQRYYFTPALENGDTIYYDKQFNRMVFSDNLIYKNSLGNSFPVTNFFGSHIFKNTTSRADSLSSLATNMLLVQEIDGSDITMPDSVLLRMSNLDLTTVINSSNNLKNKQITGINNQVVNGYQDSILIMKGIENGITLRPNTGFSFDNYLIDNFFRLTGQRTENFGNVVGSRNFFITDLNTNYKVESIIGNDVNISSLFTPKVSGVIYGNRVQIGGTGIKEGGNIIGLLHENIGNEFQNAQKLYSIFTKSGNNRFGDSTLISKSTLDLLPRAILDVKSTESMIIPTGSTAERPPSTITGQFRYNTIEKQLEFYNGSDWGGIKSFSNDVEVDVPANGGITHIIGVTGVKVGDVVVVNPKSSLPDGISIAWSNIETDNNVNIRFENKTNSAIFIDLAMRIKVIR